ncbi:hypothetical protein HOU52_gp60 [Arthrobacter phage Yang]|uniref:Uncharacterized protein n=1 Tax=Arthrobacter phage Yang TaxID=2419970 RepID=A0A3G2KJF0_9CAUD|nr:hypothetical protein HOU52_gp60 [Arthrobacter phage Yang]AYN59145.1 hypothetical protein PBI_YANG_60 [Arthrobacter phage Yang]
MNTAANLTLAETLNTARLQANASGDTEGAIYASIAETLQAVLALLVVDSVEATYQAILDGNTVRQALALGL